MVYPLAVKRNNRRKKLKPVVSLEYYQRPFGLLMETLKQSGYDFSAPHAVASQFWRLLPPGTIDPNTAHDLLHSYAKVVEREMADMLRPKSVAYWLHLFRRIGPGAIGDDRQAVTILVTRSVLEAAAQKYGTLGQCPFIGRVKDVGIDKILSGLLLGPQFSIERDVLQGSDQFAITVFSPDSLREFYELEKLAYQMWRAGALLRATGKGAPLRVLVESPYIRDDRDEELNFLIRNFDDRDESVFASGKGIVVGTGNQDGSIGIPRWNAEEIVLGDDVLVKQFGLKLWGPIRPNFMWMKFPLRDYIAAHRPYADAFGQKIGSTYDLYFWVIGTLLGSISVYWIRTKGESLLRSLQRAYDGLYTLDEIVSEVRYFGETFAKILHLNVPPDVTDAQIVQILEKLTLNPAFQESMTLLGARSHAILVPALPGRWFVDFAWIADHLFNLFDGIVIKDERFKGNVFEEYFHKSPSFFPKAACRALDGTERQIDYAISTPPYLIILECKAATRLKGLETGSPAALKLRRQKVVDLALEQVDEKARWLATHTKGRNYDISGHTQIVPIAVSPFCEFIPSTDYLYWLTASVPRVLSPVELERFLASTDLSSTINRVVVS